MLGRVNEFVPIMMTPELEISVFPSGKVVVSTPPAPAPGADPELVIEEVVAPVPPPVPFADDDVDCSDVEVEPPGGGGMRLHDSVTVRTVQLTNHSL